MTEEGTPFSRVFESSREHKNVIRIPSRINPVSISAERMDPVITLPPTKNIVMREMSVGNRPLQGTKLLVRMAIPIVKET